MTALPHKPLLDALDSITGTGVFCATGAAPFFMPELHVDGVGEVAFPLTLAQARELIAAAEAAPYGKGQQTVRDEKVRKCWQIDAQNLSLRAPEWQSYLEQTVKTAAAALGVEGKVSADLYKLLLYEKGGHFLPHRDTEKLEAMFGTLIIALPSAHKGGRLLVRHGGAEVAVDFSAPQGLRQFRSAALFADCEHEVEPVTDGLRCCLVYNLVLKKGDASALNRPQDEHTRRLLPLLKDMEWPAPVQPAASSWYYDRESKPLLAELRAFMADPAAASHTFARRQAERDMIKNWIKNHRLDLDTHTTRKSSPHQLHCTKNSASFQRALTMREADIKLLRKLEAV